MNARILDAITSEVNITMNHQSIRISFREVFATINCNSYDIVLKLNEVPSGVDLLD